MLPSPWEPETVVPIGGNTSWEHTAVKWRERTCFHFHMFTFSTQKLSTIACSLPVLTKETKALQWSSHKREMVNDKHETFGTETEVRKKKSISRGVEPVCLLHAKITPKAANVYHTQLTKRWFQEHTFKFREQILQTQIKMESKVQLSGNDLLNNVPTK